MRESALAKLMKDRAEKAKVYKVSHDVDRALNLAHLGHLLRDYPAVSALAAAVVRELVAMNTKQAELDTKEKEEAEKELAAAQAEDSKASVEEADAPSKKAGNK
jgi:hypothetical protein